MDRTPLLSAFTFGSVEHYRLLAQHDRVIIDIGEHYVRQSYRTRTSIVGPNGRQDLSVRIQHSGGVKMPMREVRLSYAETWPQQVVHAIRSAYGNSPWFIHYIDEIEAVLLGRSERLVDLDLATMRLGMKWLGLKTEIVISDEYVTASNAEDMDRSAQSERGVEVLLVRPSTALGVTAPLDLRISFHPKKPLPAEVTAVGPYPQVFTDRHGFVPRMSIIDLVMNTGPDAPVHLRS